MGLFDFLSNAQEKMNDLQKRIDNISPDELFKRRQKKRKRVLSKPSQPAADQILSLQNSLIRNGFDKYEILANRNCCDICRKFNEKRFPVRDLAIGVNAPPFHEGCCCSISAYSDRKEYDERLNSL